VGVGQTREHVRLARSLGVSHVIVAVSKMDACGYSEERFEFIKKTLEPFLAKSGFGPGHVSWVPVSGFEGVNLVPGECAIPVPNALSEWWSGGECFWFSNCLPILTLCFTGVYVQALITDELAKEAGLTPEPSSRSNTEDEQTRSGEGEPSEPWRSMDRAGWRETQPPRLWLSAAGSTSPLHFDSSASVSLF